MTSRESRDSGVDRHKLPDAGSPQLARRWKGRGGRQRKYSRVAYQNADVEEQSQPHADNQPPQRMTPVRREKGERREVTSLFRFSRVCSPRVIVCESA